MIFLPLIFFKLFPLSVFAFIFFYFELACSGIAVLILFLNLRRNLEDDIVRLERKLDVFWKAVRPTLEPSADTMAEYEKLHLTEYEKDDTIEHLTEEVIMLSQTRQRVLFGIDLLERFTVYSLAILWIANVIYINA